MRRLVRCSRGGSYLAFDPPLICECGGGEVEVRDYRSPSSRSWASAEMRYEAFCTGCNVCDPNGYGTQAEIKEEAPKYFLANVSDQPALGHNQSKTQQTK